jgi:hypothetical protein
MTEQLDDFTEEELNAPDVNPAEVLRECAHEAWRAALVTRPILNEPAADRETAYVAGYIDGHTEGHHMGFIGGSAFTRVYALLEIKQLRAHMDALTAISWVGLPEEVLALIKHIPALLDIAESKAERVQRSEQRVAENHAGSL